MDKQQMIELASDLDSTAEQLAQLVNKCIDINRLLAKHPRTPSKILDDICQFSQYDAESMRNVIRNPNVPIDALIFFGHEYPSDLMRNPALNLLLIERPDLISEIPELLEISDCPIDFIRSIVNKGTRQQRVSLLLNPDLPDEFKKKLSPEALHEESLAILKQFADEQTDDNTRTNIEVYARTSRPYCIPKFHPFDRGNPEHRIQDQVLCGFPYTSAKWPWPITENLGDHMHPIAQLDLKNAGEKLGEEIGSGLLQIWGGINSSGELIQRIIPEIDLNDPMDSFYPEKAPWLVKEGIDLTFEGCVVSYLERGNHFPFDIDCCRVEWIPVGRMFYPNFSKRISHPLDHDLFDEDVETSDYEVLEALSEQLDELEVPTARNSLVRNALFQLGGYSDGIGNTWHTSSGHMLLFHTIDYGVKVTIAVTFKKRGKAKCKFEIYWNCDN